MATLFDIATQRASFTQFLRAVQQSGLEVTLTGSRLYTLFAPTDLAFAKLPQGVLEVILNDPPTLMEVLTYHMAPGIVFAGEMIHRSKLETLHGDPLTVEAMDRIRVGEAQVIMADLVAENGVIHAIDRVLLPNARRAFRVSLPSPDEGARHESMLL